MRQAIHSLHYFDINQSFVFRPSSILPLPNDNYNEVAHIAKESDEHAVKVHEVSFGDASIEDVAVVVKLFYAYSTSIAM